MKPLYDFSHLPVDRTISPLDTMMAPGREEEYFQIGRRALELVHFSSELCRKPHYPNILDLGCGYGRVMRWLRPHYPYAKITACDMEREGVDFCASRFGAVPVYSEPGMASLRFDQPFDLIWCGSVLTHLPPAEWLATFDRLVRWTAECGIIVFTTQGRYFASALARDRSHLAGDVDHPALLDEFARTGFAFQKYFGNPDGTYGITLNSPEWIMGLAQKHPGLIVRSFIEESWGMQDVTVLYKTAGYFAEVLPPAAPRR
jgi:SAM-dependent methyltransferase